MFLTSATAASLLARQPSVSVQHKGQHQMGTVCWRKSFLPDLNWLENSMCQVYTKVLFIIYKTKFKNNFFPEQTDL